jgi:hypothetical protein
MAFYEELIQTAVQGAHTRVVAVTWENPNVNRAYLRNNSLSIDTVLSGRAVGIRDTATPTLILVDRDGVVIRTWVGLLSSTDEQQVLSAVAQVDSRLRRSK